MSTIDCDTATGPVLRCTCDLRYPWTAAHAGRRFRCLCGRVMRMPAELPDPTTCEAPLPPIKSRRFDLRACPACARLMELDQQVCTACGFNRTEGRHAPVERERVRSEEELAMIARDERERRQRTMGAAVLLIGATLVTIITRPMMNDQSVVLATMWTLLRLSAGLAVMTPVAYIMARWVDEQLDDLPETLLKLGAMVVTVHLARATMLQLLDFGPPESGGGFVGGFGAATATVATILVGFVAVPSALYFILPGWLWKLNNFDLIVAWVFLFPADTLVTACFRAMAVPGS